MIRSLVLLTWIAMLAGCVLPARQVTQTSPLGAEYSPIAGATLTEPAVTAPIISTATNGLTPVPFPTVIVDRDALPSPDMSVTDFPHFTSIALAVAGGGTVHAALRVGHDVLVASSTDDGVTFDAPVIVNGGMPAPAHTLERPSFALGEDGTLWIVWLQSNSDGSGLVWITKSSDGGKTFESPRPVTNSERTHPTLVSMSMDPMQRPIVAWLEGEGDIAVVASTDRGASFLAPVIVERGVCDCCQPSLLAQGDTMVMAFRNLDHGANGRDIRDIYITSAGASSASFGKSVRVSDEPWYFPACPISGPSLASDGTRIFVGWMDGRGNENYTMDHSDIWLASSDDGGETFSRNWRVNPESARDHYHNLPALVVDRAGRLHIAWESREPEASRLYYSWSDDGQSFSAPRVVVSSEDGSERGRPQFAVIRAEGERIQVAWVDRLGAHVASWVEPD